MNDQDTALIMRALYILLKDKIEDTPDAEPLVVAELLWRSDELDARRLAGTDTGEGRIPPLREAHHQEST